MRNNEDKNKFLETLREVPLVSIAAKRSGIDKATIYRWRKKYKVFAKKINEALSKGRENINDLAESQIINGIRKGGFKESKYWLENNSRRYAKPRPVNISPNEERLYENKIILENFSGQQKSEYTGTPITLECGTCGRPLEPKGSRKKEEDKALNHDNTLT